MHSLSKYLTMFIELAVCNCCLPLPFFIRLICPIRGERLRLGPQGSISYLYLSNARSNQISQQTDTY
jgi:hypothetical protein